MESETPATPKSLDGVRDPELVEQPKAESRKPTPPLRVLFVNSQTELGGAEISLLTALRYVSRERVIPCVATLGFGSGDYPERLRAIGVEAIELEAGRARNPIAWFRTVAGLANILRSRGFDAVVANGYHPHYYARPAAWLAGVRSMLFCRDHPQHPDSVPLVERVAFRFGADVFLVASRTMQAAVRERIAGSRPVIVVPNGVEMPDGPPGDRAGPKLRAELGLPAEALVVTVASRLQPWKGHDVFLRAAAEVAKQVDRARFLLVGGALFGLNQGYPQELRNLAEKLGLAGKVVFAGNRTDMPAVYAASDVAVLPSVGPEAFGRVVVEAMAAARPVVVSRAGAAGELFEEGVSGLGCEPGDVAGMAGCILRLLGDGDLRGRLGAAGRERVELHYSAQASARALEQAIETAVTCKSRSGPAPSAALPGKRSDAPARDRVDGVSPVSLARHRTVPGHSDPGGVALQAARYRLAAGLCSGRLVLDLGCGVEPGAEALAAAGCTVIGADLSVEALRYAAVNRGSLQGGFVASDATRLPFAAATFEAVICFELLEHMVKQDLLLAEIRRVLKSDGLLLLSTPNLLTERTLAWPGGPGRLADHVGTLKPQELRRLLRRHFDEVELRGWRRRGPRLYAMLRRLDILNLRLLLGGRGRRVLAPVVRAPTSAPAGRPEDFVLSTGGLRQATLLQAVCRRPRLPLLIGRITVVTGAYPPSIGGVADHSKMLARELAACGLSVEVLTTDAQAVRGEGDPPVKVVRSDWSLAGVRRLAAELGAAGVGGGAHVVLFQYVPHLYGRAGVSLGAALLPWLLSKRGVLAVTHFHEAWVPRSSGTVLWLLQRLEARLLVSGSRALAYSTERYAGLMADWLRFHGRPWAVLPSGPTCDETVVAPERRQEARERWAGCAERLVVVYGRATRAKRYDLAVGAIAELRGRGMDVRLLMLGDQDAGDPAYCNEIRAMAERLGVAGSLVWSGPVAGHEICATLAAADLLWHLNSGGITTRSGTAACAFAHGLPVVALRGPSLDSCFRDGENVAIVDEHGAKSLADATRDLLATPESLDRLRCGARLIHASTFSWPVVAGRCLELVRAMGVKLG